MKILSDFIFEIYQILFWFCILFNLRIGYVFFVLLIQRIRNESDAILELEANEKYILMFSIAIIISYLI